MGCDIHMFTEVKRTINSERKWVSSDYFTPNPYYGHDGETQYEIESIYNCRNYGLFSILAGVRNYNAIQPIARPRGLPEDTCEIIKKESESWGSDGHSHSYFSLKELEEALPVYSKIKYTGLVDEIGKTLIESGSPPNWSCKDSTLPLYKMEWVDDSGLSDLVEKIRERMDIFYIRDSNDIRIVFWFDS